LMAGILLAFHSLTIIIIMEVDAKVDVCTLLTENRNVKNG
jgi:hypothetical protein